MDIKISLFASSIRENLYEDFFRSLEGNKIEYEVVFAGNKKPKDTWPKLKYIETANIKPAQCYEIARRECQGELIMWVADDCEFSPFLLDNVYEYWKSLKNPLAVISVKTNENKTNNNLNDHRFYGYNLNTPLMAPLGVMKRQLLEDLGGLDRRYVSGQYENDIVMRVYAAGGKVYKYEEGCVFIEHLKKHGTETKFWTSYDSDRRILEESWTKEGYAGVPTMAVDMSDKSIFFRLLNHEVTFERMNQFEPYSHNNILTESQSNKGIWE